MNDTIKTKRSTILTTIFCCVYLLITIFYHHIDKHLTGVLFIVLTLLIPTLLITIVVYEIKGIIQIISNRQNLSLKFCLPTIICSLTLLYTIFSPYKLDSENLESEVEFRACYEGTQNQAYIKFRQNKSFELNWTGAFGYDEWWTGTWKKIGDTLLLKYNTKKVEQLGDTILIANGYLNPIGHSVDTVKFRRPMFYLGYCRHEN
jgi:type III secretory pathway component EscS